MKRISIFLGIFLLIYLLGLSSHFIYLYSYPCCGVSQFITYFPSHNAQIILSNVTPCESKTIYQQRFSFCGRSREFTSYLSKDGEFLLRFFNTRSSVDPSWFIEWKGLKKIASIPFIFDTYFSKKKRFNVLSQKFSHAFKDLSMETGLLDVQLEPHNNAATEIELEEENHEVFKINLMNYPHVVQKYADPLFVYFDRMIQQEEIQYLKQSLASLCDLFYLRAKKGYTDQKKINEFVLGFKEGVAQQLEVVGLSKCEKGYAQPFDELKKKYEELKFIIICRYPELDMFLSKLIQEKLDLYKIDVDFI